MANKKPWYKSKTILGFICMAMPNITALIDIYAHTHISNIYLNNLFFLAGSALGGKAIHEKENLVWRK